MSKTKAADFDFSHVTAQGQKDEPQPFEIYELRDEPIIYFRPATKANSDFQNASMRRSESGQTEKDLRRARRALKGMNRIANMAKLEREANEQNAEDYAHFCATSWEGVFDAQGNEVEFSAEACAAYLKALPEEIFTRLNNWIKNANNFRKAADIADAELDGDDLGNESQSA